MCLLACLVSQFLLSLPSPITVTDLRQPSLDPSQLVHLGPPALSFIARSNSHSTADSIALLSAARLILAADRGDMAVLGRLLVEQVATVSASSDPTLSGRSADFVANPSLDLSRS